MVLLQEEVGEGYLFSFFEVLGCDDEWKGVQIMAGVVEVVVWS